MLGFIINSISETYDDVVQYDACRSSLRTYCSPNGGSTAQLPSKLGKFILDSVETDRINLCEGVRDMASFQTNMVRQDICNSQKLLLFCHSTAFYVGCRGSLLRFVDQLTGLQLVRRHAKPVRSFMITGSNVPLEGGGILSYQSLQGHRSRIRP